MKSSIITSNKPAIILLSGGIDSTTVLACISQYKKRILALTFDYGQSLKKEINFAKTNAKFYNADWKLIKIDMAYARKCSLINKNVPIQENRTLNKIQSKTPTSYVPFRNGIFFSYAISIGESLDIEEIYAGCNGLNSGLYPDDTKIFADYFKAAAYLGTNPKYEPKIYVPFANISKKEIVEIGKELQIDYNKTWSCYKNGKTHCNKCDSCKQRQIAFNNNKKNLYDKIQSK